MIISFYKLDTGRFTGRQLDCDSKEAAERNMPKGCSWIAGQHDKMSKKVQVIEGKPTVVDFSPEPGEINDLRRKEGRSAARAELDGIDRRLVRYLADIAAGTLDAEGRRRFDALQARKLEFRAKLKR